MNFKRIIYCFLFMPLFLLEQGHAKIISTNKKLEARINRYFKNRLETKTGIEDYLIANNYFKATVKNVPSKGDYFISNPIQSFFIIRGNEFISDYAIQKITKIDKTKLGVNLNQILINSIKEAYQKQGFQKIHIKQRIKNKKFKEWIYIKIKEGLRSRIAKIHVTGLLSKSSEFYSQFIIDHSSPLIKKGYFNRKDLEKGYKNLIEYLKSEGYLTSKIYSDRVIQKKHLVYITINLEEGPVTLIKNIRVSGNQFFSNAKIISFMKSKIQSPLRYKILEEDLEIIKDWYNKNGYLEMDFDILKNTITYDKDHRYAFLNLTLNEGVRSVVSQIVIKGNQRTKKELIEKSLKFKVTEILTPKNINQSIASLNALGIFKSVNITHDKKEKTTVTVNVSESKSRFVRGGVGLTTQRGITTRSYIEYTHKNFFRYGRVFFGKLDGQANIIASNPLLEYKISGNYQETFFIEKQIKGNVTVSRSKNIFSYFSKNVNTVEKDQIHFSIDKVFEPYFKINFNLWNLETRKESCLIGECPTNFQKIGSTHLNLSYDRRDNVFNPKKGFFVSVTGEYATPLLGSSSDIQFWKLYFQNQFYISFLQKYLLAIAFRGGLINSSESIPVGRAFLLGGQSSIRGYDGYIEGERIPDSVRVPIKTANERLTLKTGDQVEPVKKTDFGLFKIEMRFPLFKNFTSLIFYDLGAVRLHTLSQNFTQYGHSAGLGFRYETFLIPIGLDIGYKIHPKFGSDYKFHLSIGLF